jgi:anti-sigma-K factor RskA
MISDRHEELAALHALDLLEGAERAAFEAEVAAHPELRALVERLRASSAALALTAPQVEPPVTLRQRVLSIPAGIGSSETDKVIAVPWLTRIGWGLAAVLALGSAWLTNQKISLQRTTEELRLDLALADMARKTAELRLQERSLLAQTAIEELGNRLRRQEDLSRLKINALASLAGNSPEARAIAVWDPDRETGLLSVEKLPALASDQDYQLWVIDPGYKDPVNGGVFTVTDDGRAVLTFRPDQPVKAVAKFAVSRERKGGVPKAEGPIILLSQ